ncbi:hypothetical protein ASG68_23600 [Rhizobium sp. Leaf453]|nr:hypothetical protein ASG68_23600 [Rhizobium sp. Leaf453]
MFVVLLIVAPLSQKLEPPANPARFKHSILSYLWLAEQNDAKPAAHDPLASFNPLDHDVLPCLSAFIS